MCVYKHTHTHTHTPLSVPFGLIILFVNLSKLTFQLTIHCKFHKGKFMAIQAGSRTTTACREFLTFLLLLKFGFTAKSKFTGFPGGSACQCRRLRFDP